MSERKTPAAQSKPRASRHTAKSIAAGKKNLEEGHKKMAERRAAARAAGLPTAGERWGMLLDGSLTVQDLDDKEIKMMRVRNADGGFSGKARNMPSHLMKQFRDEAMRREKNRILNMQEKASKVAKSILDDPEAKDSDKIAIIKIIWDRNLGKSPETVVHTQEAPFEIAVREAAVTRDIEELEALANGD